MSKIIVNKAMIKSVSMKQQGIAIISVLIIVALVAALGAKMSVGQQRFIKISDYMVYQQKQMLLALSVESLAKSLLIKDIKENKIDTLEDEWATELEDSEIDNAILSGVLVDQKSKININNLIKSQEVYLLSQFNVLFDNLEIDKALIDPLIDYLDADNALYSDRSAESSYYSRLDSPYVIANGAMHDISELYLVKGFTRKIILKLSDFIWAGPENINTINVNTASVEVLKSLSTNINEEIIKKIVERQNDTGFNTSDEFIALISPATIEAKLISVASDYFLLQSLVDTKRSAFKMETHIKRQKEQSLVYFTRRVIL